MIPLLLLVGACTKVLPVNTTPYAMSTNPAVVSRFEAIGPVRATYCHKQIVMVPIIGRPAEAMEALQAEATRLGGVAVVDVRLEAVRLLTVPLYSRRCFEFSGTAVRPFPVPPTVRRKK